jgi:predicted aminopeptidase
MLAYLTVAFTLLLVAAVSGCHAPYILRAAYEEARILSRREPISELLEGDALDATTRAKLRIVLDVRTYAAEQLGLRVAGSYASLAETDDSQIVHTVSAARRDRLEFYTWWFPIVGRVPYRGFFDQADAEALAASLEREGYDSYVRGAVAFSTLGWFDDPLLSPLLRFDEVMLAEIIVHELLHNTIYVAGQTRFNESFASFVGFTGAADFFARRGDDARVQRARDLWADEVQFSRFLDDFIAELGAAYAQGMSEAQRNERFAAAQRVYTEMPQRTPRRRDFSSVTLNNAKLLHYQLYAHRLDVFDRVAQRFGGDHKAAIAWVGEVAEDAADPFDALSAALEEAS